MSSLRFSLAVAIGLLAAGPTVAESLITLETRPGVTQSFLFETPTATSADTSAQLRAAVILFAGAGGVIGLGVKDGAARIELPGNFLVRSRHRFAEAGLMVATVDAPSDQRHSMSTAFRIGPEHARDIAAVAAWLKQRAPVPVWLVGTSQGSVSAAALAVSLTGGIDGLALTSSVVEERRSDFGRAAPLGVLSIDLEKISVPTLVMAAAHDACPSSPPAFAPRRAPPSRSSPAASRPNRALAKRSPRTVIMAWKTTPSPKSPALFSGTLMDSDKPPAVTRAERALWIWAAWIFAYGVYSAGHGTPGIDQDLQTAFALPMESMHALTIGAYALAAASVVGLAFSIGAGKRWGRITLLIGFILQVLWDANQASLSALTDAPDLILQGYALYMLYTRASQVWFREKRG